MAEKIKQMTPMMQQYLSLKEENQDCLLFFRLGDFYELFMDDAITASRELDIVLTGRDCGLDERAPMCGVPFHSVDGYINKLISKGYKVAICEQLTDPSESKGIVERGIIRIVTPGTVTQDGLLDENANNYIVALCLHTITVTSKKKKIEKKIVGIAYADVNTGEYSLCECSIDVLLDEISRIGPAEIILCGEMHSNEELLKALGQIAYTSKYADWAFNYDTAIKNIQSHFAVASLEGLGCAQMTAAIRSGGALLAYLKETQKVALSHITKLSIFNRDNYLILDANTRRNLELTQTIRDSGKKGSLLALLDSTKTAMGARMLRSFLDKPLGDVNAINERLDGVQECIENVMMRSAIRDRLREVSDLERICSRIAYDTLNAREAIRLKESISALKGLKDDIEAAVSHIFSAIHSSWDDLFDIQDLLQRSIAQEPPLSIKDGGIIADGYNEQVDKFREASEKGKSWLDELERREKEATGIKNLRVGFNKVFGYYIEVTKSYISQVPFRYQRKQTLANCERYVTEELKEIESQILGANDKLIALEYQIFCEIRKLLSSQISRIQAVAMRISMMDALQSLAHCANEYKYTRPQVHDGDELKIVGGRHPVVERALGGRFVENDTDLDNDQNRLLIITGPNMAGKSTYMRQVALISVMAHIGSFVPAASARIPMLDRIFTRVGASDDLSGGRSTFMVEMSETANILNFATRRSLLLLDEIGRGTSTFDGLSIAWAVSEYIADEKTCGAKTLFATHYHELSELEGLLSGVVNYRITAKEVGEDVVFLRKVVRGGSDKSFGIQVARLAGLPAATIERAKEILAQLEAADLTRGKQTDLFVEMPSAKEDSEISDFISELSRVDINTLSPIEALQELYEYQKKAKHIIESN